jgi:hypothetical protein
MAKATGHRFDSQNERPADGPKTVKITAIDNGSWIVQPVGEFGPPLRLPPAELAEQFDAEGFPPEADEDAEFRKLPAWLAERSDAVVIEHAETSLLTVEEKLVAEQASDADD